MTINRGGSVLLDVYKQEINIAEARLKKSARLTTSALYRLWIDIRQRIEHILKISEDEIISADSESISKLLSQVKYEFKTIDMTMKSKLKSFIEFALKRIHPLDNPLLEEVLRTTPTDIIEQLKSMPISYFGDEVRNNPYWMELGHNKYLHNMVDSMIHAEKSNIIVQKSNGSILKVDSYSSRFIHVFPGIFFNWKNRSVFQLYYESDKMLKNIGDLGKECVLNVIGSYPPKSAIYVLVSYQDLERQRYIALREIIVPKDKDKQAEIKIFVDELETGWKGKIHSNQIVLINIKCNKIKIIKIGQDNTHIIIERQIFVPFPEDSTESNTEEDKKITMILSYCKHMQTNFDFNNTHLICSFESKSPLEPRRQVLLSVSMASAVKAVVFEQAHEIQIKNRIVTAFKTDHIASILISSFDQAVTMTVFYRGNFHAIIKNRQIPAISRMYDKNDSISYLCAPIVVLDGSTQRIKIWKYQLCRSGKIDLVVKAFNIIV